jgi:AMMECR1 domain-containing protein
MATKPTTKKELESNEFDVDTITMEETIVPKETKPKTLKDTWVIKDRTYIISDSNSPLTYTIQSKHSLRYPLLWFNKETGEQEELRYATNQNSPLVSQQKGQATLGHIIFENGILNVPKEKQNLQKLLSLYHPALNIRYTEFDPTLEAEDELEDIELEVMALNAALEMDIDQAESIVRVEVGSRVNKMSSKEIKRDLLLLARNNPSLFIELANDDNVQLRNIAIRAVEASIVKLSPDNRTFHWGENNRKLMTVPFDENPYSAMAAFFKTDEGIEVFKSIEKKLK